MKKSFFYLFIIGCITCIVSVSWCFASDTSPKFVISPFAGGYLFEGQQAFGGDPVFGLNLGYEFSQHWAVRLGGAYGQFQHAYLNQHSFIENVDDIDATIGYVDLKLSYPLMDRFSPYFLLGAGDLYLDIKNSDQNHFPFLKYGAGLSIKILDRFGVWGEFSHCLVYEDLDINGQSEQKYRNNAMYMGGFSIFLGESGPSSAKLVSDQKNYNEGRQEPPRDDILYDVNGKPWDSDGDGINEQQDHCSGTPAGIKVDANGCPLDQDKDGVFDYMDHCQQTGRYVTVDKYGCPKDSDSDGVYDMEDHCPDTPNQAIVDIKGCPMDPDNDGVFDGIDQCPKTAKGLKVDEKGCPRLDKSITVSLNIAFQPNSFEVDSKYFGELKNIANMMKQYPKTSLVIQAHTDSSGGRMANLKLSQKRADSVRHYLIDHFKIDPYRIEAVGFGEEKPIADNSTKAGRIKNRRAVAILSNK
ncbi:flagellar motor protein MotB [Candidatus Magnetomorum sp. HK-1]|nr:flagellar motor protein MotB [Candidatus Magnetomorum sp. HK-1]